MRNLRGIPFISLLLLYFLVQSTWAIAAPIGQADAPPSLERGPTQEGTSSHTGVTLLDGLVAYYPFNGNAVDASGHQHDGIVHGAVLTTNRFGTPNSAYSFNGLNAYIEVAHDAALNPQNAITFTGWFQANSLTQVGNILAKGSDISFGFYVARLHPPPVNLGLGIMFTQDQPNVGPTSVSPSNVSLSVGQWYFFALTYDGQVLSSFVDGVLIKSLPVSKTLGSNLGPLVIGKHPLPGYEYWFNGKIDDIRLYDRALSANEISALYMLYDQGSVVPPWAYANTGISHTIIIPKSANPNINDIALSAGDYVGVFYDSSGTLACAGYEKWTGAGNIAVSAFGDDPTTLAKDGFADGEEFKWRICRASDAKVFDADALYAPVSGIVTSTDTYATNGISQLMALAGSFMTHCLDIRSGWSLISSYVRPQKTPLDSIFKPVLSDVIIVKNGAQLSYIPSVPVNSIGSWVSTEGYQIKMSKTRSLCFAGQKIVPQALTIELPEGWSIMPYVRDSDMPIASALSGVVGDVVIVKDQDGKTYIPSAGVNEITTLRVGQAYQIKMVNTHTIAYPARSTTTSSLENPNSTNSKHMTAVAPPWFYSNTGVSHTIIIPSTVNPAIDGMPLVAGDYVGVFYDSSGSLACAGYAAWSENPLAVSALGDDQTTTVKDGLAPGETFRWKIWRQRDNHEFTAKATYSAPGFLEGIVTDTSRYTTNGISAVSALTGSITSVTSPDIPAQYALMQNYPNPFNPATRIRYDLPWGSHVSLTVLNTVGQTVAILVNGTQEAGYHEIQFDAGRLPSGLYFYKIKAGDFVQVRKLLLLK